VLTFDEGWLDGLTTMMPLLARPDIGTSFFVCPGGGTGSIRS
jgi:peptidoglycan/xylan/chitin deacetylase (PgdA/CDA1 family)